MPFELFVPKNVRVKSYYPRIYAGGSLVVSKEYLLKSQIKEFKYAAVYMDEKEQKIGIHFTSTGEGVCYKCSESGTDKSDLTLAIQKVFTHFNIEVAKSFVFIPSFEEVLTGKDKKKLMILDVDELKKRIGRIENGEEHENVVAIDQKKCIPVRGSRKK